MFVLARLFPKARAEVLRLLMGQPGRELHLRDLSRLAGLTPATLQKELANFTASGLVTSRRDGNRLYFRANTDHPVYPELRGLVQKTSGIAAQLETALAGIPGVVSAFIFGSVAAGTDNAASDVDVLILGSAGLRKTSAALRGVSASPGREINPHCLTVVEWRTRLAGDDAFVRRVASEPKLWLKGGMDVPR